MCWTRVYEVQYRLQTEWLAELSIGDMNVGISDDDGGGGDDCNNGQSVPNRHYL